MRITPSPCCARSKQHDQGSTVINTASGLWNCWACGAKGNWYAITKALGEPIPASDRYIDAPEIDFSRYEELRDRQRRPITDGHYPNLLAYCRERGFNDETLNAWRVSSCGPDALRFPIFALRDGKWEMVNARIRKILNRAGNGPNDWFEVKGGPTNLCLGNHLLGELNLSLINHKNFLDSEVGPCSAITRDEKSILSDSRKRVFIVEGQWDAMTAWQIGIPNVLSLPNGASNVSVASMLRYVPDDYEVWLGLDMDDPGDRATEAFFAQLGPDRVARAMLPFKDLNDWLKAVPDLKAENVYATVKGITEQVTKKDFVISETKRLSEFLNILDLETETESASRFVTPWPWPRLNKRLGGGIRTRETTGLLAPSGIGKTTFVNQIAIEAAREGVTVGIISLEGSRTDLGGKLLRQMKSRTGYIGDQLKEACARLKISRLEGTAVTWQECLAEAELFIRAGARLVVVDNLDYIMPRGINSFRANAIKLEAYAAFQDLSRNKDIHTIMVWQPNKIDRDKLINSGDQKGMSQALQDSDNYLNLNRVGNLRRVEIEKTRQEGVIEQNKFVFLKYVKETGCLDECDHHAELELVGDKAMPEVF
jgi:archaellum biogenesis ATPase FlaH